MAFTIHFINVDTACDGTEFPTAQEAIDIGIEVGFDFAVFQDGAIVASWSCISGLRRFTSSEVVA